jgi:hypothetical protein
VAAASVRVDIDFIMDDARFNGRGLWITMV